VNGRLLKHIPFVKAGGKKQLILTGSVFMAEIFDERQRKK
jgi:ribosome-associated protein YbcJ (S4-like RNA binding protein)